MFKKRFANLFDFYRKRKGIVSLMIIALLSGIIGLSTSCTQDTDSKNMDTRTENSIIFKSERLGFELEFPEDWRDKYIVEESDNSAAVFSKTAYEKYSGGGLLFTIVRVIGELITEEDMQQEPVRQQIVLQGNGYTYFTRRPSDMQYPPDDAEVSSDYETMSEQITNVHQWMSLLGDQKPKALNEGFKVVGSSFFTVEIPSDWELKVPEDLSPCWNLYHGDNRMGEIEQIPYRSEGVGGKSTAKDNTMREYLFNDEVFREIRITLNSEFTDQSTMENIKKSFKFTNGPFNVVDLHTNAEQYLAGGGKKIFGTIEDFQMKNGKPIAVRVNVMKLLTDDPNNEYPNGFCIEDLKQTETYSLDFGVSVAPLAAPNYNTYSIYEIPLLDENFLKNYENYKDFFYDFVIGGDGQLKIVLGHYIP